MPVDDKSNMVSKEKIALTFKSFSKIYKDYFSLLVHYASIVLQEKQLSEDVVQEVFMDLWEKRNTQSINNYIGYLHNAVKYKAYRTKKRLLKLESYSELKQHHAKYISSIFQETVPSEESGNVLKWPENIIGNSIDLLPCKCKSIFCLYYFDRLTYKEIAKAHNISTKTVDNHIYKARKRIKEYLIFFHNQIKSDENNI